MDTPPPAAIVSSRTPLTADAVAGLVSDAGPLSAAAVVDRSPSTNTDLLVAIEEDGDAWPHLSVLLADHQTAGRGRAGREWITPAGAALTVSFVLDASGVPAPHRSWIPLAVGLAVTRALRAVGVDAWIKWPNDVVVKSGVEDVPGWGHWRKVCGILCETAPDTDLVVAGVGVNVSQSAVELPVEHAASLALVGARSLDRVELLGLLGDQIAAAMRSLGDAQDLVRADISRATSTLKSAVVVDRPGENPLAGDAVGLASDGALLVRDVAGTTHVVHAGDVRVRRPA